MSERDRGVTRTRWQCRLGGSPRRALIIALALAAVAAVLTLGGCTTVSGLLGPRLTPEPKIIDFGHISQRASGEAVIKVRNTGYRTLVIQKITPS